MPRAIGEWKVCSKCKEKKHVSEYNRRNRAPDCLDYSCKSCLKKYHDANRDSLRKADRKYAHANKERLKAKNQRYSYIKKGLSVPDDVIEILSDKRIPMTHKEAVEHSRNRHREYKRTVYKETHNRKNREYQQTERGKDVNRLKSQRYRARKSELLDDFSEYDLAFLIEFQGNRCGCCKKEFTVQLKSEIDHIIPVVDGGGFTLENAQLLCRSCNASKGVKTIRYIPEITNFIIKELDYYYVV